MEPTRSVLLGALAGHTSPWFPFSVKAKQLTLEAISSVGKTLGELWKLFADIDEGIGLELGELTISEGSSPDLSLSVDALDLSERPRNCLGRENITTVGQILEYTEDDLLNLTNFGQKSLDELVAKLDELGLSLPTSSDLNSEDNSDA